MTGSKPDIYLLLYQKYIACHKDYCLFIWIPTDYIISKTKINYCLVGYLGCAVVRRPMHNRVIFKLEIAYMCAFGRNVINIPKYKVSTKLNCWYLNS